MGLLDHLFKPKPGQRLVIEAEKEGRSTEPAPSGFLTPKPHRPRAPMQVVLPTQRMERRVGTVESAVFDEVVLLLGDVLPRIPSHLVRQGVHEKQRELHFALHELATDLAHGRADVDLQHIVKQCPDVFVTGVEEFHDVQIRLPLQKLVEQIGQTTNGSGDGNGAAQHAVFPTSGGSLLSANSSLHELQRESDALAALPGVRGCFLAQNETTVFGGEFPGNLDPHALRAFARHLNDATFGMEGIQHATLQGEEFAVSVFARGEACVCAVHRARSFLPNVRERFAATLRMLAA